ncbi:MAG: PASTA domain-containing protein [Endomicrobium sp.]|nr:PASTA domain-containing protein [Endomicrobium sp.]
MARKLFKVFIFLAIIGLAFYFAFNMVMVSLIHNKKEVSTPDVIGKNLYRAVEDLSREGFGLKLEGEETDQNVPAGTILRQNPPAAMTVREGKVIKVTISRGGEIIYVPDLVGQSIRSADISLRTSTLVMGEVTKKYSAVFDKDIILSQDIPAGTKVDKDSVVNLVVSDGQPPEGIVLMPKFINKNIQEVSEWSLQTGVNLNIKKGDSSEFKSDVIISQYPQPDMDITGFNSIDITVSQWQKEQ